MLEKREKSKFQVYLDNNVSSFLVVELEFSLNNCSKIITFLGECLASYYFIRVKIMM